MTYKKIRLSKEKTLDEHRLVWIKAYGEIPKGYVIHHIDGDKTNNSLDNLECLPLSEHSRIHQLGNHMSEETKEKLSKAIKQYYDNKYKDIPEGYLICNKCKELLPLDKFYKISATRTGYSYTCRDCRKKYRSK